MILDSVFSIGNILPSAIQIGVVFLLGCVGEIIIEKSGNLNLGIPGVMCFGATGGALGCSIAMKIIGEGDPNYLLVVFFGLFFCLLFGAIAGLIYSFLTVTLHSNQNVVGLALTIFGGGFANFLMNIIDQSKLSVASKLIKAKLPFADSLGVFGDIVFGHGILVYLALGIAIAAFIVLKKTRIGLSLRAVGENPATADAAGINVTGYKYGAALAGSMIAGIGGFFYVMDFVGGSWENSATIQGMGWLALALVMFTVWNPLLSCVGSLLFGFLYIAPNYIPSLSFFMDIVPYLVTIIVLVLTSIFGAKSVLPPASLGVNYFREER
ncbi:MAG: ABC transporter permease [Bacilli bacterium]|nr:ABC transporter permease [Bacilli bacterium]